jgi:DNA-binding response OmpR family regulator
MENKKILIVEDDSFLRTLLKHHMDQEKLNATYAVNGEEALLKIPQEMPDLILLDILLPGKYSGLEVLEKIKADPATKNIPVVILSNLGQKKEVEMGLELGAKDYLVKAHFTLPDIMSRIKKTLGIEVS